MKKNRLIRAVQFIYALPSRYMSDLPGDRRMIFSTTSMGALVGGMYHGLVSSYLYDKFIGDVSEGGLGALIGIGSVTAIPVITNIISGIYEYRYIREENEEINKLEQKLMRDLGLNKEEKK